MGTKTCGLPLRLFNFEPPPYNHCLPKDGHHPTWVPRLNPRVLPHAHPTWAVGLLLMGAELLRSSSVSFSLGSGKGSQTFRAVAAQLPTGKCLS